MTRGSPIGGTFSLLAIALIVTLLVIEVYSFFKIEHTSQVELDHATDTQISVNLNITLPHLSCDFASLTVKDVFDGRERIVGSFGINKFTLDGYWEGSAMQGYWDGMGGMEIEDKGDVANAPKIELHPLDAKNFYDHVRNHDVTVAFFYGEECKGCHKFEALVRRAGAAVPGKIDELSITMRAAVRRGSVSFTKVDCSARENSEFCHNTAIHGLPSNLIFRYDDLKKKEATNETAKLFEVYNGVMDTDSIASLVVDILHVIVTGEIPVDPNASEEDKKKPRHGGNSKYSSKGCRIEGAITMGKFPTEIIIRPESKSHEIDTRLISMDHTIHHLSVGFMLADFMPGRKPDSNETKRIKRVQKQVKDEIREVYHQTFGPGSFARLGTSNSLRYDESMDFFRGTQVGWNHYVRVVPVTLVPRFGIERSDYDYTFNSNVYIDDDYMATEDNDLEVPAIIFKIEVSPLRILLEEKTKSLGEAFINLMALLGGIYSCSIIFEGLFTSAVMALAKKMD